MELLQKIDLKTAATGQNSLDKIPASKDIREADSDNNNAFKDQLDQQIDQSKSQEKLSNNQQDSAPQQESVEADNEAVDDAELAPDELTVMPDKDVSENVSPAISISQPGDASSPLMQPSAAAQLPEEGSFLPPLADATPLTGVEGLQQGAMIAPQTVQSVDPMEEVMKQQLDMSRQQQNEATNKIQLQNTELKTDLLKADAQSARPAAIAPDFTTGLSEKINAQDARYAKLQNEMPAADVITQTTRMQQVPVTTALSASSLLTQSISTATTGDSALLSNITPSTTSLASAPANSLSSSIAANIQNPAWSQQMTQQVSYMIKGGFKQAEIKLNPAHLGPMEIKLSIKDDQTSINFVTQHAMVRDVVDSALPRLRDMLEQQGLNLLDVDVSTQSEQQQTEQQQASSESQSENNTAEPLESAHIDHSSVIKTDVSSGLSIFA